MRKVLMVDSKCLMALFHVKVLMFMPTVMKLCNSIRALAFLFHLRLRVIKERVFLGLRESTKLFDLSCNLSTKYKMGSKMKPLCGKYESLAARLEKLANRCSINSVDTDWHDPSYDINKLRDPDKYSSDLNDPLLMSNVLTYDSANANSVQEDIDIPLTPLVEKYSLEKLSGRTRFNSECMGSIPELACFQIHEDSNITEEDEKEEMLTGCPGINYSTKELTGRKPPDHVTSVYQNREKSSSLSIRYVDVGRFGLTTPKTSSMNANRDLHIRTDQAMKNPKENRASSIRKGKLSQPLQDSKSRAELLNQKNARHRSEANLGKGWKPSNTVTNMTPFAPLVKQNQQFRACVKEDTRVKALEAAEAAKRRQEKKKNKRDMRRAAAEQKQKQKQVKQKNKIDTDVTRKRQREDDTNKEKGKKKKYTDGAQIPEQQVDRMHATNGQKYGIRKNYDDKEPRHDLVGGLKHELVPCERAESVRKFIASESNDLKAVVADGRSECSVLQLQENFSDDVDKSYEMYPCKDSDEEDNDNFEHHEEVRRRRKFIPSWSREENLDKILLSNQSLDPAEIFGRNGCFSLSDVLALHVPQRIFS
uniref:Uncharacterized protein n=1 Tax=Avena sativa TaxID=4498 RepID=A0ACD6ACQ1_AVESA